MSVKNHLAPYVKPAENEDRKRALKHIGVGAAITGSATAAEYGLDRRLKRKGAKGPVVSAVKGKFKPKVHVPHLAGRMATRSASAAGVPVMAYGLWNIVNPKGKVDDIDLKRDVIRPAIDHATMRDSRQKLSELRKSLTQTEENQLVRRKERGTRISHLAGGLGVAALAARAPQGAKFVATHSKKAGSLKAVKRLASNEKAATGVSNTLGVASIGTGSIGSFNYAAQQKLEAKQVKKSLYDGMVKGIGRVRVIERPKPGYVNVYDARDVKRFMPESRVTPVKKPKAKGKVVPVDKPAPAQLELFKADKFLREYGDRISPKAEEGYKHLKDGRDSRRARAAVGAGLTGLSGVMAYSAARGRRLGWTAAHAGLAGLSATSAVSNARAAGRWDARMDKIKAKAKERAAAGEYGKGRLVEKADKKDNDKRAALAAGVGVGAGAALLAPTRQKLPHDGGASDRIAGSLRNRDAGQAKVSDVRGVVRGSGARFSDKTHVARLAADINDNGYDPKRPIEVTRFRNGGMVVSNGHHRLEAVERLGHETVPVRVTNANGKSPKITVPLGRASSTTRRVVAERQPRSAQPMSEIRREAAKPIPKWAARANRLNSRFEEGIPGTKSPRGRLMWAAAGGAGAAAAVHHYRGKKVEKALLPKLAPKMPRLGGGFLKPRIKQSYVGTSSTGKKFTVRGTVR